MHNLQVFTIILNLQTNNVKKNSKSRLEYTSALNECTCIPLSVKCLRCGTEKNRHEDMMDLILDVEASNGSWYKMNDSVVKQVELREVLLAKAYLLFYSCSAGGENTEPSDSVEM
uniref:USP domain-containing protein n=1 Tax=Eptatretus burgeri TaxID=7764 RepID=A0A8C4R031_EPTBU